MLIDPPAAALTPKPSSTNRSGWKVPSPLLSAAATPLWPKPTMSARPSPVRSARNRGCVSTRQPLLTPKSREYEPRGLEGAVTVVQCRPHAVVAEADDVGPAIAGEVGEKPRMRLNPPAAGGVAEVRDHLGDRAEGAVAAVRATRTPRRCRSPRCRRDRRRSVSARNRG